MDYKSEKSPEEQAAFKFLFILLFISIGLIGMGVYLFHSPTGKSEQPHYEKERKKTADKGAAQIFIASIPSVADVYLGEKFVGKTNVSEIKLPSGTHVLRFVKGSKSIEKTINLNSGRNPSLMVRIH